MAVSFLVNKVVSFIPSFFPSNEKRLYQELDQKLSSLNKWITIQPQQRIRRDMDQRLLYIIEWLQNQPEALVSDDSYRMLLDHLHRIDQTLPDLWARSQNIKDLWCEAVQGYRADKKESFDESLKEIKNEFLSDDKKMQLKRMHFEKVLLQWENDPNVRGNKGLAAIRIRNVYNANGTTLDLKSLNLSSLPSCIGSLSNLRELNFSGNVLLNLPESIGSLVFLQEVNLESNQLESLPLSMLSLSRLERLNLAKNKFSQFPVCIISFSRLLELNLSHNKLQNIPEGIENLSELECLDLSKNLLSVLPQAIGAFSKLKTLDVSKNILIELPYTLSNLLSMEVLNLQHNHLQFLSKNFGNLSKLTGLNLQQNKIEELSDDFGSLVNLRDVDLSENKLHSLPETFSSLSSLISLKISTNLLKSLPKDFRCFSYLDHLDLAHNNLESFPDKINLPCLKRLNLSYNHFKVFPESIAKVLTLKVLNLGNNQIEEISDTIVLPDFEELNLEHNLFKFIPMPIFKLGTLKSFKFGSNRVNDLHKDIEKMRGEEALDLSNNQIQSVPETIAGLNRMKTLNLSDNLLEYLPAGIGALTDLSELEVHGNRGLAELPLSLGTIPNLTHIDRRDTQIPEEMTQSILDECRALRDSDALKALPERLNTWKLYAKKIENREFDLNFIIKFSLREKTSINDWLVRLAKTCDFASNQKELAHIVCSMLESLQDLEFKKLFFVQVEVNLEGCHDHASMALNEIYTAWILYFIKFKPMDEQIRILIGIAKTTELRNALSIQSIEKEGVALNKISENVEIFLYYEIRLKKVLGLVTAITKMGYPAMGNKGYDEEEIKKFVLENYRYTLIHLPAFEDLTKLDKNFSLEKTKITVKYAKLQSGLEKKAKKID